jgi:positive regulator of sigma E activity
MADRIGIVIRNEKSGWARVAVQRSGGASGCLRNPVTDGCKTCHTGTRTIEGRAANPIGAVQGDLVRIRMRSRALFKGLTIVYLVPIVLLMLGAVGAEWAGPRLGAPTQIWPIIGALLGFALGLAAARKVNRSAERDHRWLPVIRQVLSPAQAQAADPSCRPPDFRR